MKLIHNRNRLLNFLLIIALLFTQFLTPQASVFAATPELVITGSGVNSEVIVTANDWSKFPLVDRFYSSNNSLGFHKIIKVKGYDLETLIGKDNLKSDLDYTVSFLCADGFKFEKKLSDLFLVYTYSDFTENSKELVKPMFGKYKAVLGDYPKNTFSPPVSWSDRDLTENDLDNSFPKLVFGQKNIDDMNMSQWGKEVIRITIGDEIPNGSTDDSPYRHLSYDGAPYNVDAISGATFTIEGPGVEGYRAISVRQIEEDFDGHERVSYYENVGDKVVKNTYEGINAGYLIENYVKARSNAGDIVFKNKSRQTILRVPIEEADNYTIAYGVNEVPYVYLDLDVGYKPDKYNDNGCFKLVYNQTSLNAKEFSNVAYIYVEEKDAKNIYEHTYSPYNNSKYTDYEIIIHGDALDNEVRYKVSDIENMNDIKFEGEYSLSNSEYFWYYNTYKGVELLELLKKAGVDMNLPNSTSIQFVAADNYNFAPMTLGEIKDYSLYGYYEKDAADLGDGNFDGNVVKPLVSGLPPLVAYGFNGYPYVTRPTDEGYNPGLGNDGGPLRIIFGKTNYNDTNGSNQVQFLKEIIVGGGSAIGTGDDVTSDGESTLKPIDPSTSWNHNRDIYKKYLNEPVLRITGSQVKEPVTLSLAQIESLTQYAIRDIYTGDGVREFEGIVLWDLIAKAVGLKDGVDNPNIRVFSGANYNQILRSNEQVINGVDNSKGENKKIILGYAVDGYPLVPNEASEGYVFNNANGPLRLLIEENKSMWVKWVDCIVVGTGDYEKPLAEDLSNWEVNLPGDEGDKLDSSLWIDYRNNTGKEMVEASVRAMEFDHEGNLYIGTNNGGISIRSKDGNWSNITSVETLDGEIVKVDTTYAILQRENGQLWVANGSPNEPRGILVREDGQWSVINKENSILPACFVQELEADGNGGLWIGTANGLVHVDKDDNWVAYTQLEGLLPYSVDALEADKEGGVWIGYYPDTKGSLEAPEYIGGYQYLSKSGEITTYDGFDSSNFNVNWVRSISLDLEGGVWVTRSGNAPGFTKGEVDYIKDGVRKVYKAKELFPDLDENSDIRLVLASNTSMDTIYIGTKGQGVVKLDVNSKVNEVYSSENTFSSRQWDDVYFIDWSDETLFVGTNGGAGLRLNYETFLDIKDHWAMDSISKMAYMGYVKGFEGEYRPSDKITRAEFVTMIVRVLNLDPTNNVSGFVDVLDGSWYKDSIDIAAEKGIVKGYSDNTFKPNDNITRAEIASILMNLYDLEINLEEMNNILAEYKDDIPSWANEGIAIISKAGLMNGFPDGSFGASRNATRAEAAVILLRYLKN